MPVRVLVEVVVVVVAVGACRASAPSAEESAYRAQQKMRPYDGVTRCGPWVPLEAASSIPSNTLNAMPRVEQNKGLSGERIAARIDQHRAALGGCFHREAARTPGLEARVLARFTIGRDGTTSNLRIEGRYPEIDACLCDQFARIQFARADAVSTVSYPLFFHH